jgi:hypothetical protein
VLLGCVLNATLCVFTAVLLPGSRLMHESISTWCHGMESCFTRICKTAVTSERRHHFSAVYFKNSAIGEEAPSLLCVNISG